MVDAARSTARGRVFTGRSSPGPPHRSSRTTASHGRQPCRSASRGYTRARGPAVCRRAEREVLALSRVEEIGEWPLRYVNRLSDLFFVLGRWVGKHMGEPEYLWERGLSSHARRRAK